jgi:uncharacterized protein YktB (UPF0637 family)
MDPLAPDAPIYHLLSIRDNPMVKDMSTEQLQELVKRMRAVAQSPQTMTSALQRESKTRKARPKTEAELKRQAILDSL